MMAPSCYLCVERPPPPDLRSHLLFHHMIENDRSVPLIMGLSERGDSETQTTVTWVREFEYYDNRKRKQSESQNDNIRVKKSKPFYRVQRHKKPSQRSLQISTTKVNSKEDNQKDCFGQKDSFVQLCETECLDEYPKDFVETNNEESKESETPESVKKCKTIHLIAEKVERFSLE